MQCVRFSSVNLIYDPHDSILDHVPLSSSPTLKPNWFKLPAACIVSVVLPLMSSLNTYPDLSSIQMLKILSLNIESWQNHLINFGSEVEVELCPRSR